MNKMELREAIIQKYIAPTRNKKSVAIGIEFEVPILNMSQEKVEYEVIQKLVYAIIKQFDFTVYKRDDNEDIYAVVHQDTGDMISFDYSYCNMEFSLGVVTNLHQAHNRFKMYYTFITDYLGKFQYAMTGMGVNPYRIYNDNNALPAQRYRMIQNHLESYVDHKRFRSFHSRPNFGSYSCASQVQLDVTEDVLIRTLNVANKLEPIKAMLFANSLLLDDEFNLLSARDRFWESSMYGYNKHNIGGFETEITGTDELVDYIKQTSLFNVARDGKYIFFTPIPAETYFQMECVNGFVFEKDHFVPITIHPMSSDLEYLRSYKFSDLTFRGTLEYRSACCQPVSESMCVAAFHLGLQGQLDELESLLNEDTTVFHRGYSPTELRAMLIELEFPKQVDKTALQTLTLTVLEIAKAGLVKRGLSEEDFLIPLFQRAHAMQNPAMRILNRAQEGKTMEQLIKEFGTL